MTLDDSPIGALAGGAYGFGAFSLISYLALKDDPEFQKAPVGEEAFAVIIPGIIYGAIAAVIGALIVAVLPFEIYPR